MIMAIKRMAHERIAESRKSGSLKAADVEYRVLWNKANQEWDCLRNGAPTGSSARKKKQSAIDSAVRDAKAELENSDATIMVICVEARKIETVWKGP
jgi:hypothetical protein